MGERHRVLEAALKMYEPRVCVAVDARRRAYRTDAGMYVMVPPDFDVKSELMRPGLRVLCLDRAQVVERVDVNHPTARGAFGMIDSAAGSDELIPFGVIFLEDKSILVNNVEVFKRDRD